MYPFKLASVEEELKTSKDELQDIMLMYADAEESRKQHLVYYYTWSSSSSHIVTLNK